MRRRRRLPPTTQASRGELDTQTGDLQTLIGRPLTSVAEIIRKRLSVCSPRDEHTAI
jgi:hypothetical protein